MNIKSKLLLGAAFILIAGSPALAGMGGTHVTTDHRSRTETVNRHSTRVRTEHQRNVVPDVTVYHDVTRVHPRHHVTEVTRVLHHTKRVDTNEYATHSHVAAPQVEHSSSTEHVGAPAAPRRHDVTRYHDVYQDDYKTVVHEVTGSPAIDHEIHRHVTDVTVQPIVHENDVTRVILDNVYQHHSEVQHERVVGSARTIVTHRREDVDP